MQEAVVQPFAKIQPAHGDTILHCGHADIGENDARFEFFLLGNPQEDSKPINFKRPDGSTGEAKWLVVCKNCVMVHGRENVTQCIRGDAIWIGNDPEVH